MTTPLHIGFIPLVDAAALIVAVDKGFCANEGLDVTLVRSLLVPATMQLLGDWNWWAPQWMRRGEDGATASLVAHPATRD